MRTFLVTLTKGSTGGGVGWTEEGGVVEEWRMVWREKGKTAYLLYSCKSCGRETRVKNTLLCYFIFYGAAYPQTRPGSMIYEELVSHPKRTLAASGNDDGDEGKLRSV